MRTVSKIFKIFMLFVLSLGILLLLLGMKHLSGVLAGILFITISASFFWPEVVALGYRGGLHPANNKMETASLRLSHYYQIFWRRSLWVCGINFLSFITLFYLVFTLNDLSLLLEMDGSRFENLVRQQDVWFPFKFGFTNNYFHSLGNIWYPLNMHLDPGFHLAWDSESSVLDRRLSYLIFSSELFLSTYLLCMLLRQGAVVSSMAAWIIVLLGMPYIGHPKIYVIFTMAPNYPISQTLLILCLFRLIGRHRDAFSAIFTAAIVIILGHTALAHPTAIVLMVPTMVIFSIGSLAAVENRRELIVKIGSMIVGLGILGILGFPKYLIGIFQYTAPYFFSTELFNDRKFYFFVSILFSPNNPGKYLFYFSTLGGLLYAFFGRGIGRAFAIALLTAMTLLMGFGVLTVRYIDSWRGPSPIYFEFFLWPIYAIFAAIAFRTLYILMAAVFKNIVSYVIKYEPKFKLPSKSDYWFYPTTFLLAALPWAFFVYSNPGLERYPGESRLNDRLVATPIVSALQKEIGLTPGSPFRGRVVTLTGQNIDKSVYWHDLVSLDKIQPLSKFGNTHRSVGLWFFSIPTLLELSSLISPPFFLVTREFLERPGDLQMRNVMVMRKFNARILRALGVRFVIIDAPIEKDAELKIRLQAKGSVDHYLYELNAVNLGNYSPIKVVRVADVSKIMSVMSDPDFDFSRSVILESELRTALVPATSSQIFTEPGRLRLSAKSQATSLIVLPFEFSNCLSLRSTIQNEKTPRLFRANLLHAGILFTERLEATLTYFTGPFKNSGCRIEDKNDMERLKIRQFRRNISLPPSRFPGLG